MFDLQRSSLPVLAALLFAASSAHAQDDCAAKHAAAAAARAALQKCLSSGKGCEAEFEAKRVAEAAVEGCPEPTPTPASAPRAPDAPPAAGKQALLVEAPDPAAVEAAAREALAGAELIGAGEVRAARAFGGPTGTDDESLAKLRGSLGASRLIAIQVKSEGASRFVGVRAVDASGVTRAFAESSEADLAATVKRLVAGLPAPGATAAAAPVAVATAVPAPTPAPVPALWRPLEDDRRDDDELRFGKRGTMTFSMGVSGYSASSTIDAGVADFSFDSSGFEANPTVGYFLADGVLMTAGVFTDLSGYSDESDATENDNQSGITVTAAYLARLGPVFVGPELASSYSSQGHREEDADGNVFNYERTGLTTLAALALRCPIGTRRGGVLGIDLFFLTHTSTYTADIDADLRTTEVGITQGISVFF